MNKLQKIADIEDEENINSGDTFENFELLCKTCGSKNIKIELEESVYYGELTGWEDGYIMFKCKSCGAFEKLDL